MAEKAGWEIALEKLKEALDTMPRAGTGLPFEQAGEGYAVTRAATDAVAAFAKTEKDVNLRLLVFSQLDVDRMIALARAGAVSWWGVFTGRAFFGDVEGMKKVWDAAQKDPGAGEKSDRPDAGTALKWLAEPYKLAEGYSNKIEAAAIRRLLEWKADPNAENGRWLEKSLRSLDGDCIRALVDHGANPETVFRVMADLHEKKNFAQVEKIQDALSRKNLYFRVDDQTLMETKYIPDVQGGSTFKTLFNFRARRVTEIYEYGPDRKAVMTGVPFSDYDPEAVGFAREQLLRLGGKPRDGLDKPKMKLPSP